MAETWTTSDFDNNLDKNQLDRLKNSVSEKVISYIKKCVINYGDETFKILYGDDFINDKFEVIKAFWITMAHYAKNNRITFSKIDEIFRGTSHPTGRALESKLMKDYKEIFAAYTLKNLLWIIETLTEVEMAKNQIGALSSYSEIFALDNALRAILENSSSFLIISFKILLTLSTISLALMLSSFILLS